MQRQPRRKDERHLRFIRDRHCIICGYYPADAAHIKMADARVGKPQSSNIGMKADDRFTLPLCRACHEKQHSMPERLFWDQYHFDAVLMALALYSITGDGELSDWLIRTNMLVLRELA